MREKCLQSAAEVTSFLQSESFSILVWLQFIFMIAEAEV